MSLCPSGSVNLTSPNPMPEMDSSSLIECIGISSVDLNLEKSFLSGEIDTFAPVSIIQAGVEVLACSATAMFAKLGFGFEFEACRFVLNSGLLLAVVDDDEGCVAWPSGFGRCGMLISFSRSLVLKKHCCHM